MPSFGQAAPEAWSPSLGVPLQIAGNLAEQKKTESSAQDAALSIGNALSLKFIADPHSLPSSIDDTHAPKQGHKKVPEPDKALAKLVATSDCQATPAKPAMGARTLQASVAASRRS